MPLTLVATNDLAGTNGQAFEAYTPPDGHTWTKTAIGGLVAVVFSGAGTAYGAGLNWTEVYYLTDALPTSVRQMVRMAYGVVGLGGTFVFPCVCVFDTVSGRGYYFGYYNGGGGNNKWSLGYFSAPGGADIKIIEDATNTGVFTQPSNTDVQDLLWDPATSTLTCYNNHQVAITGTVSSSSTAVTGTGTTFLSDVLAGDILYAGGGNAVVASVTDDTHLTLSAAPGTPWSGATAKTIRDSRKFAVFTANSATITGVGAPIVPTNRGGIYAYIGNVGQTSPAHNGWRADIQVYKDVIPPFVAGTIAQSGPIYPNLAPFAYTSPSGGLGAPYGAQLMASSVSGSGYTNVGSAITGIPGSAANLKTYPTTLPAGTNYVILRYTDGSSFADSNEVAVVVPATTAASSLSATGSVLLAGSVDGAAAATGFAIGAAFDGDKTSVYHGNSADSSNLTMDAHVAVVPIFIDVMPRRGNDGVSTNYETLLIGDIFESATQSNYSDAVALTLGPATLMGGTQGTAIPSPTPALYPGNQFYRFPVLGDNGLTNGATAKRFFRLRGAAGSHCDLAEFRIGVAAGTAAQAMPAAPVWSPGSGRGITSLALTCPTTSPGIVFRYNTTNTPVLATDTVYSGAITPPPNAETVYRARAFDALLSTPAGDESLPCTIINPGKLTANTIMRDDRGIKIDAAAGHIIRSKGYYWWAGDGINLVNFNASDTFINYPGPLYRSRDLIAWEFMGYKLPPVPKAGGGVWGFNERRHFLWDASLHKFVEISHVTAAHTAFAADNLLAFATADTMDGTWTRGSVISPPQYDSVAAQGVGDIYPYQDAAGVVFLYYRCVPDSVTVIGKMGADYQSFTGGGSPVSGTDFLRQGYSNQEGLILLRDFRNNNILALKGIQNYYRSDQTYDASFATAAGPLSTFTNHATNFYEGGDPLGTDYNGQLTCALWIPQKGIYIILSDYWFPGNLSASNPVFQTLALSGTPSVPVLETTSRGAFSLSDLADVLTGFAVAVSPGPLVLAGLATQTFTAVVTATGGTPDQDVVWSCSPAGSIVNGGASDGLFTAPAQTPATQTITITATYYDAVGVPTTGTSVVTILGSATGGAGRSAGKGAGTRVQRSVIVMTITNAVAKKVSWVAIAGATNYTVLRNSVIWESGLTRLFSHVLGDDGDQIQIVGYDDSAVEQGRSESRDLRNLNYGSGG